MRIATRRGGGAIRGSRSFSYSASEACTCTVPCTCNFGEGPSPHHFCWALFSLDIKKGNYGKLKLNGLRLAGAAAAKGFVVYLDDRATPEQAAALKAIAAHIGGKFRELMIAQDPKLLLVDEPVAGMTDAETVETAKLLKEIARTRSVVVVEHDMSFVRELGTRVTCLAEGSVLAEGSLDQVSQNPVVIERYLGR